MNNSNNSRVVTVKAVLWTLVGVFTAIAVARFIRGLGSTTALTDSTPWGMWIGFDVLAGVALAAGGFVIAATVHIFRLEKYNALVRPAILTAFLGYVAVVFGLLMDLGRPWNIWRMIFWWQPDSPLFEVGWCVMLYSTVLALEFAPVVFEGLNWEKPLRIMRRLTLVLVVAGIGLSTLHQSSLGTLFLLAQDRMHPLWYSPWLPVQFLISAIALGLVMVTTEGLATSWLYRREPEWLLLRGLTRASVVVLSIYVLVRLGDLAVRGDLGHVLEGSWASALFVVELLMSAVVPIILFTFPSTRNRHGALTAGALLAVSGFILHRADVGGISHVMATGDGYIPALTELFVSLGVVSVLTLVFLFLVERFPVWEEKPEIREHFTPPTRNPVTRTYFGGPWFGGAQLSALGWIVGVLLGMVILETTMAEGSLPRPRPVRPARTVEASLLIDGDRSGTYVLFDHADHKHRLGGDESCIRCHHANNPLDRGTRCGECHSDMYRVTDIYSHQVHVRALGANRSCVRCHADPAAPKTRSCSKECSECHSSEMAPSTPDKIIRAADAGMASGYRAAMHGICIDCHRKHELETGAVEPRLSRCQACHRDLTGTGEELRLREGWIMAGVQRP